MLELSVNILNLNFKGVYIMNRPIAIFDAGLGSYAIVEAIKKAYPLQDIIYFADRKNFPYGTKTTEQLKTIIENSIDFLLEKGASFIVLASNAPSITVLDKIKNKDKVIGIYPPLKDVIRDKKKNTLIIGAKVMIESSELQDYIKKEVGDSYKQFHVENASPLIQLIESGDFINNIEGTKRTIRNFIDNCEKKFGKIDSITLSSTHLPWLGSYFKKIIPQAKLYDPADSLVKAIKPYITTGEGKVYSIISESEKYPAKDFLKILDILKIKLDYEII